MKDLTYTIIHIKVGVEKYWEEVGGFVSGDKETLLIDGKVDFLYLDALKDALKDTRDSDDDLRKIRECFKTAAFYEKKRNYNHPLSELANKLGATVYGSVEDEKDFYLVLPTIKEKKAGDVFIEEYTGHVRHSMLCFGKFEFCEDFDNYPSNSTYGFYWKRSSKYDANRFGASSDEYDDTYYFHANLLEGKPALGNIFQEYARTGIIENDLYKQFIK
jgi:hypothetical protein